MIDYFLNAKECVKMKLFWHDYILLEKCNYGLFKVVK